ncbi:MAG: hypothetical protein DME50_03245 [Verrucomicrobia bacterium]|nr:MAG: hypothetical protein DME85_05200 [Verrucomicrobiota bacterium]PYK67237.1 MAG: hypothetical protein DME50_03245 [Verrucomicrobiota bacterium]
MKRILVPIDFSDVTSPVIDLARQLARAFDADIHLVHVENSLQQQHRAHWATAWRECLSLRRWRVCLLQALNRCNQFQRVKMRSPG